MKTASITPATIEFDAEGMPHAPVFGDVYHARAGALAQAEHVFLRGNGLPARWAARPRFVVLETGFGLGHNFLATWAAWRRDGARCQRLHFVSVEKHPPRREDLARTLAHLDGNDELRILAEALRATWPPLTGDLHRMSFEQGRVELLLALGDAASWLRRLQLQADAVYLDGFAPERNPQMWSEAVFAALPALSSPGCTAATWSVARTVRDGLARAGFAVETAPGFAGKREMSVAHFAPRHRPPAAARRQAALPSARDVLVIGAGLAGAQAALALSEQGLAVTVLEAAAAPAAGASGNPAGLVRGLVSRDDGAHARWHRAAALEAQRQLTPWLASGAVAGHLGGVLHLADALDEMQRYAAAWPADYVQALHIEAATALAGLPLPGPAWFFPGGGWVDPAALVSHALATSGAALRLGCRVMQLQRRGPRWLACGEDGLPLAEADVVVLANAAAAEALAPPGTTASWNLGQSRGQVSWLPQRLLREAGCSVPRLPLARNGYVIALPDGRLLCGATQSVADADARLRAADHEHNLGVLARLTGWPAAAGPGARSGAESGADASADASADAGVDAGATAVILSSARGRPGSLIRLDEVDGRVGWRCHADDRLPLVGPLPSATALAGTLRAARLAQPRHVPREAGLFTLTALGSRGITSAALGARTLAALVCDAPLPVDTDLLDAVDAARHVSRALRRGGSGAGLPQEEGDAPG